MGNWYLRPILPYQRSPANSLPFFASRFVRHLFRSSPLSLVARSLDVKEIRLHGKDEILKIFMRTVDEGENSTAFEETTEMTQQLEVKRGEIVLAPEKHGQTVMTMSGEVAFGAVKYKGESVRTCVPRERHLV